MIAYGRPFWPLFLHVLGAMTLVGAVLATLIVALVSWRRSDVPVLRRAAFAALLAVGVPSFLVMRIFAEVIRSDEGLKHNVPGWLTLGRELADAGVLVLLASIGVAYWWKRSSSPVAGRILAALSSVYLVMLAVAWLAMTGKWG